MTAIVRNICSGTKNIVTSETVTKTFNSARNSFALTFSVCILTTGGNIPAAASIAAVATVASIIDNLIVSKITKHIFKMEDNAFLFNLAKRVFILSLMNATLIPYLALSQIDIIVNIALNFLFNYNYNSENRHFPVYIGLGTSWML